MILYLLIQTIAGTAVTTSLQALTRLFTPDTNAQVSNAFSEILQRVRCHSSFSSYTLYAQNQFNFFVPSAVSVLSSFLQNKPVSEAAVLDAARDLKTVSTLALGVLDGYLSLELRVERPNTFVSKSTQRHVLNSVGLFTEAVFLCEIVENRPNEVDLWRDTLITLNLLNSPFDMVFFVTATNARAWSSALAQISGSLSPEERRGILYHGKPLMKFIELLEQAKRYFEITVSASRRVLLTTSDLFPERNNRTEISDMWKGVYGALTSLLNRLNGDLGSFLFVNTFDDALSVVTASLAEITMSIEDMANRLESIKLTTKRLANDRVIDEYLVSIRVDQTETELDCPICQEHGEDFQVKLPCSHVFHGKCLKEWLIRNPSCPLCRAPVQLESTQSVDAEEGDETL
jgi:hypothetical protein